MRRITATIVTTLTLIIGIGSAHAAQAPEPTHSPSVNGREVIPKERQPTIVFRHGDISWLPQLADEAGWPPRTWKKLGQIILRESGGCPNRSDTKRTPTDNRVPAWRHQLVATARSRSRMATSHMEETRSDHPSRIWWMPEPKGR